MPVRLVRSFPRRSANRWWYRWLRCMMNGVRYWYTIHVRRHIPARSKSQTISEITTAILGQNGRNVRWPRSPLVLPSASHLEYIHPANRINTTQQRQTHDRIDARPLLLNCSVLFFSRPRSKGWPHYGRTFSIYPCPLSFWLTLPRRVLSTSWCCPSRPCVPACTWHCSLHNLFLLVSSRCDQSMLASLLWRYLTVPSLLQFC